MICSFARKSRHPPQTGVPPSVRRVWPEFPSDSETWIEFRRNYSLRLKPEPARHPCAASPPQQVQIFSNYWGAGNIFKYWAIIEKLVVILSILQISGSRLIRILAAGCVPIPISGAPLVLFICIWWKRELNGCIRNSETIIKELSRKFLIIQQQKLATDVTLSSFSGSMFPISLLVGGGFCGCTSRNVIHQKFGGSAREVLTDYATGTKSARPRLMGEVVGDAAAEQIWCGAS